MLSEEAQRHSTDRAPAAAAVVAPPVSNLAGAVDPVAAAEDFVAAAAGAGSRRLPESESGDL